LGLTPSSEKDADVVFILSCSVRKSAVDRVMSVAENNSDKKVVVCGCVLENDMKKYEKKSILLWDINKPGDLINILGLPKQVGKSARQHISKIEFSSQYLPITIGCNNFCSYCAVPYVRGREKSRPFDDVVSDFKKMLKNGHKKITLLGQNVNSYQFGFSKLLKTLNNVPGDFEISFTSNHPKDMTDDVIAAIRDLPKVKKEIHLPLQSGSNKILKAMNRPYTKEKYLKLVEKIKKEITGVRISTDSIIGFPGETEADFQETVDVYKKVGFFQAFNNKYSPRSGTAAFKLGDPIPWKEKERRWKILNEIANKK